ncbi:MAG: glycosyltransferase family 4 protein, partial [Janthinobacterium lividum]
TRAVGVSAATARAFAGNLPFGKRVGILHNGVDLSRFPPKGPASLAGPMEPEDLRHELGLAKDTFLFCAIGQIAPRKGLRELIEAFAETCAASGQTHLVVVGEPLFNRDHEYRDALTELRSNLGLVSRVHFLGARKDVAHIMRSVNIVVLNSLQEPFGLVLVEAMSSGTAVLAANVGGIPEIVTNGLTGWLVSPTDLPALAARMRDLVEHRGQLEAVQKTAIETVCPRFSEERFLKGLQKVYAGLSLRNHLEAFPVDVSFALSPATHTRAMSEDAGVTNA